jgi:transposase
LRQKWSRDRSDHLECDRAIREISKRGNRYLRVRFVQTAWAVLVWAQSWERHGLKPWTEAAKKRPHHDLAIALANKLARIGWAVPARAETSKRGEIGDAVAPPA